VAAAFEEVERLGSGAASLDSRLIGVPVVERARDLLKSARGIVVKCQSTIILVDLRVSSSHRSSTYIHSAASSNSVIGTTASSSITAFIAVELRMCPLNPLRTSKT